MPTQRVTTIEVYQGRGARPWRFRVIAGNGEKIGQSQGYARPWNARRAARRFGSRTALRWRYRDLTKAPAEERIFEPLVG